MSITFDKSWVTPAEFKDVLSKGLEEHFKTFGSAEALFAKYDAENKGMDAQAVARLLRDAGYDGTQKVGPRSWLTKTISVEMAAEKMVHELDTLVKNGRIDRPEFLSRAGKAGGPAAPSVPEHNPKTGINTGNR